MDKTGLGTEPVGKLLIKYSLPAIIAMVVNAIYNIVDRIFIGQFAGEEALAGLTLAFPIMMVIFAVATLIGQGGGNLISIRLGEKDRDGANRVFTTTMVLSVGFGLIAVILGVIALNPMLNAMSSDTVVIGYAIAYMTIIFFGFLFQIVAFALNSAVRSDGFPIESMKAMLVSALTNIVLDYIFIALFGWGVQGAALATIIGQLLGCIILLRHFIGSKTHLTFLWKQLKPDFKLSRKILSIGTPTFVTTLGTSISMMLLNSALDTYGGTAAVTSMGAINSLFTLFIMPIMGMQGGIQPIIGYNHGAEQYRRVKTALYNATLFAVAFSAIIFAVLQLFPNAFISLFLGSGSDTIAVAVNGLRIYIAALPVIAINIFGTGYFQAVAKSKHALFLGALRQFIFLTPLILILPRFTGLNGVWWTTPISDLLAVVTTIALLIPEMRKLSRKGALEMSGKPATQAV